MINTILATYARNRATKKRAYPWTFILGRLINGISTIIFPFIIYTFLFDSNIDSTFYTYTKGANYITYIVLGSAIQVLGISTLMSIGRSLIIELREGTLDVVLLSPASRIGYFIGCQLEQITDSLIQFFIIIIVGCMFGANVLNLFNINSFFIILIIIFSFFSMGICLCSIMLYTRDTYITQNTLFVLMSLLCGVSFPIEYLPKYIQPFSHIFPMTSALKLFRSIVISKESILDNVSLFYEVMVLSILYLIIGTFFFKRIERKLSENIFN